MTVQEYDCALAGGDPTGRKMSEVEDFPQPAQEMVIPYVTKQKLKMIDEGKGRKLSIKVWKSPEDGKIYILDGQHRFIASCIRGVKIDMEYKKFGFPPYRRGWENTARHIDVVAAKDVLRAQGKSAE